MAIDPTCPKCGSKTTQSVTMLIQAGTSVRKTVGVAAGGLGRRRGGGVHTSTSVTKSGLVSSFTPPQRPQGALLCLLGIIVGAIASLTLILAIIGVPLIVFSYKQLKKQPAKVDAWREEMARFEKLWVCKKCGNEWTPAET